MSEVLIDGVRYVPASTVSPQFDDLLRALLEPYWGWDYVEEWAADELHEKARDLWVQVYDDNDDGRFPTVLAFVTDLVARLASA